MVVVVASLVALNVYTLETLSLKSATPIPGYPSVTLAYSNGSMMLLIKGALGPYLYDNITINGTYQASNGQSVHIMNSTTSTIFFAITMPTTNASFKSTALDLTNHQIYFFNATVAVNLSTPSRDVVTNFPGGQLNTITLGISPIEETMEGYGYS